MTGMDERLAKVAGVLTQLRAVRDGNRQPLSYYRRWSEVEADTLAPLLAEWQAEDEARALREAADEMEAVIADGDVAEVAAFVPGEVGRGAAVARRDALYEEPHTWLRDRAALAEEGGVTTGE